MSFPLESPKEEVSKMLSTPLLVGISGGADSTYLLHALATRVPEKLIVCHLHHGLRGLDADADADFVRKLADQYALSFELKKVDLPILMKDSGTLSCETLARHERFAFFKEIGLKYGTDRVALAHHADDQAETVLMHLCRGSKGLSGIQPLSYLEQYQLQVWRPLLQMRKRTLVTHLEAQHLKWREDATNAEGFTARNRIRNEVIPLLDSIFERDVTSCLSRNIDDSKSVISELIAHLEVLDPQGRLYLPKLELFSQSLQKEILFSYLKKHQIPNLSDAKITECLKLLSSPRTWKVNLPNDRFLRRKEKRIFLV